MRFWYRKAQSRCGWAMTTIDVFAAAKINLTLHVTGQRDDGYHLLESLVVFADIGDHLRISLTEETSLNVGGPMAADVPSGPENLVCRAAALMQAPCAIELEKHLPAAAGIGGGSADAAAVLRGISQLTGAGVPQQGATLGADVPVCLFGRAAIMSGIGEQIAGVDDFPKLHAVLVNPGVSVATPSVFSKLATKENSGLQALPAELTGESLIAWLAQQRNDLEASACALEPVIGEVLRTLKCSKDCRFARMSGSGATCFGLYPSQETAQSAVRALRRPGWWVQATRLG